MIKLDELIWGSYAPHISTLGYEKESAVNNEVLPRNHEEDKRQAEGVQWLQNHGLFFFSVPNEAAGKAGNMKVMGKLKALGLRSGAPDLVVCDFNRVVFLEYKKPEGTQSEKQKQVESHIKSRNLEYYVIKDNSQLDEIFLDK